MTASRTIPQSRRQRASTVAMIILCGGSMIVALASAWTIVTRPPNRFEVPTTTVVALACGVAILALGVASLFSALEPRSPHRANAGTAVAVLTLAWSSLVPLVVPAAPGWIRFAAFAIAALLPAALLHLVGALSPRSLHSWVLPAAYGGLAALAVARELVTPPFLDVDCRVGCDATGITIVSAPTASHILTAALVFASALSAGAAAGLAVRSEAVAARRRQPRSVTLGILAAIALFEVVVLVPFAGRAVLGPLPPLGDATLVIESAATAALAVGLLVRSVRRVRRIALLQMALETAARADESPGLEGVLAHALRDPHLRLDFWLPTLSSWADGAGAVPARGDPAPYDEVTIMNSGAIVARVRTGRSDVSSAELLDVIGPASLLLIDSERLRVERRAQAKAIQESLRRIVETSDAARRQLERDLHDGAQQRLLAAILAYRLASGEAESEDSRMDAAAELEAALDVLYAVRETAHGVYPPVLADAGLIPALESLARTARVPMSLSAPSLARFESSIEFTFYLAVREALSSATDAAVAVTIRGTPTSVALIISPSHGFRIARLADRVGALGGSIRDERDTLTLDVPCG